MSKSGRGEVHESCGENGRNASNEDAVVGKVLTEPSRMLENMPSVTPGNIEVGLVLGGPFAWSGRPSSSLAFWIQSKYYEKSALLNCFNASAWAADVHLLNLDSANRKE